MPCFPGTSIVCGSFNFTNELGEYSLSCSSGHSRRDPSNFSGKNVSFKFQLPGSEVFEYFTGVVGDTVWDGSTKRVDLSAPNFSCGDLNGDGNVNPVDVVAMVNYVYKNINDSRNCYSSFCADLNGDGLVNPVDVVKMVNYVYKSGAKPTCTPAGGSKTPSAIKSTTLNTLLNQTPQLAKDITNDSSQTKITTTPSTNKTTTTTNPPLSNTTTLKKGIATIVGDFVKGLF